jgi:ribosomal-protein-serine acetyltransferase
MKAIATPRLSLVPSTAEHLDGMWKAITVSRSELRVWMAWAEGSRGDVRTYLERSEAERAEGLAYAFTVIADGAVVGSVGVNRVEVLDSNAEIGYWIRSDLSGRGLITEAVAGAVEWAFGELGLHRLELRAGVDNGASIRVAEKIGFTKCGVLRQASRGSNGWYDCYIYELLADDDRLRLGAGDD